MSKKGGSSGGGGGGKGKKPIFEYIETEDIEGVRAELEKSVETLETRNKDGFTPLITAAYIGNIDILNLILSKGGNPTAVCKDGDTPLHYSCAQGHLECMATLGSLRQVNLLATDNDGETPMDVCENSKAKKMLEKLIKKREEEDERGDVEGEEEEEEE